MPEANEVIDVAALSAAVAAFVPAPTVGLSDTELMEEQRTLAAVRRRIDARSAELAEAIAHRSRRELGHSGLAQRLGARSPEKLVQTLTGSSLREAQTFIRVGELIATPTAAASPSTPWLVDVAAAVTAGTLSLDAADVIRAGLGAPTEDVTVEHLLAAATRLLRDAPSLTLEQLAADARNARAELDLDRVHEREAAMRDRRFLRFTQQLDGMTRVSGLLDPESAAHIVTAVDAALAPRRGPRFVDPVAAARAAELERDPRSNDQIVVDTFVDLIRIATNADDGTVLGSRHPVVQIHVTDRDLRERRGLGSIEGQLDPVSIATIERYICESGAIPIGFDQSGQVLNLGREQRTFTTRQRIALAARDGGCRFPGCNRPVSWAEAHHITEWSNGGKTDIADGILLCRFHHMMIHNNGWQITRERADYYVTPPVSVDPRRERIPMPSRSRVMQRALAAG
jgi:hypothetical protein